MPFGIKVICGSPGAEPIRGGAELKGRTNFGRGVLGQSAWCLGREEQFCTVVVG